MMVELAGALSLAEVKKMYSWGGSTADWNKPGAYSFDSARAPYLDKLAKDASAKGPRSYSRPVEPDMALVGTKGKTIRSESKNPIVVGVDVTGSMASWPAEIFDRLPLFYQTLSQYCDDVEVSFGAIGDATCDDFPLQVNNFGKGVQLEDHIKALFPEGGGGGQIKESYELFAYVMDHHCDVPNATSPFLFIFGDEKFYDSIDPAQVRHWTGDALEETVDSAKLIRGLTQKFNVYFLHKPYGHGGESDVDRQVVKQWSDALGAQRIIELPSAERAVDIAMGIVAKHWGHYEDFGKNLSARQDDPAVQASVHASLRFVGDSGSKNSMTSGRRKSKLTKSLSEMYDDAKASGGK